MEPNDIGTVRATDSELYYEVYGSGRPLVLVHGDWMDRRIWQPQIEALASGHQVIAYDLRGHGRSTLGELPYAHIDDLVKVMDALGLNSAVLAGHGIGGSAARGLAIEQPQRVDALVMVSASVTGLVGVPVTKEEGLLLGQPKQAALDGDYEEAADLFESIWINGVDHMAGDNVREGLRAILDDYTFADMQADSPEVMWTSRPLHELHLMHLPVLITWGVDDQPVVERTATHSADVLPEVHTGSIEDAAHFPNWEQAAEFNALVLEFLGGLA